MLSFAYALLAKEWTITLASVGFDPHCGVYHRDRHGRPSLALDMMEPFRPLIADSTVVGAINNGVIRPSDFTRRVGAVSLQKPARKRFIQAFERRMDELITHPTFGYRLSYRRVFEVQARLFGRTLAGELDALPHFVTR
jgi:CRISPR-associated protein Cas1